MEFNYVLSFGAIFVKLKTEEVTHVQKKQSFSNGKASLIYKTDKFFRFISVGLLSFLLFLSHLSAEEKVNYGFSMTSAPYDSYEALSSGYKMSGNFHAKYDLNSRFFIQGMAGLAYQYLDYDPGTETYFFWEDNQYNTIEYTTFEYTNIEIPISANLNYKLIDNQKFELFATLGLSYHFVAKQDKNIDYSWEYDVAEPIHGNGIWDDYYDFGYERHFYALDLGFGIILPINDHDILIQYQKSGEDRFTCRANKVTLGFLF